MSIKVRKVRLSSSDRKVSEALVDLAVTMRLLIQTFRSAVDAADLQLLKAKDDTGTYVSVKNVFTSEHAARIDKIIENLTFLLTEGHVNSDPDQEANAGF